MAEESKRGAFVLDVPLDASGIDDFKPDQAVKVVVQDRTGALRAQVVQLDAAGHGAARFTFEGSPGAARVIVGPESASDEEMTGLQTISVEVPVRQWAGARELRLAPIKIHPYFWHWWPIWCRAFTIRGVVVCPDGRPVPGAKVCAYDVDWWWWWSSKQLIKCDVTDAFGAFEITFKWCCGWWPWWWWKHRFWRLEPALVERIAPVLQRDPGLQRLLDPSPRPSVGAFEQVLADEGVLTRPASAMVDPTVLPGLRDRLLKRLPQAAELERLRIWPWWPWHPWWDCTPDIIFTVTQDCEAKGVVIVDEGIWDARRNIPTTLNVTLVANERACCLPTGHPCTDGECLALTMACSDLLDNVGGNIGAPVAPVGYANPGLVSVVGDRPYGGQVDISGTADCMSGVDYYEFEWATTAAGPWNLMPPAAAGDFDRVYLQFTPFGFPSPTFSAATPTDGHHVYETLQHYEATNPPADWGANRVWLGASKDVLMRWRTEGNFADGAYYLRVKGWDIDAAGHLINPRILPICEDKTDNYVVLRVDNRFVGAGPTDAHGHACGTGTIHTCTNEPEAAIIAVTILHGDGTESIASPCGNVRVTEKDWLQVDFVAHDPDGHLAKYTLQATYDVNLANDLLALGGALTPSPVVVPWAPAATQVGPTYTDARSANPPPNGGASAPIWHGGVMRLKVKATGPGGAFPYTCCYQLELRSHKRTIVDCDYSLWGHANYTEYSFTVVV